MQELRVLEWIRHRDPVWTMPRAEMDRLAAEFPAVRFESPATREEADAMLPGIDVVLGFAIRSENFAAARRLRWIHSTSAGVEWMLFPELVESDVVLTCSRGLHARSMAEHALAMMLAMTRQLPLARDAQRERRWTQHEQATTGFADLHGTTLGLIGFGHVGRATAALGSALGMHVIAVRRHPAADPSPAHEQWGLERLPELLERADWVVLAAPSTRASRHVIGAAELARMKPGARIVNVGRGALVDEPALIEALRDGRIAGAALDVCETEPLPDDSPLWTMPQVLLTPHVSGLGPDYWSRARAIFARHLRAFVAGEPLENVVDKRAGY
jgi:phosphoglycerate dehydrogenase-like enzyme